MTEEQLKKLRASMPWQERVFRTAKGGVVQVIDKNGAEVPLFTITAFLAIVTQKMAIKDESPTT